MFQENTKTNKNNIEREKKIKQNQLTSIWGKVSSSWSVLAISGAYRCDERFKKIKFSTKHKNCAIVCHTDGHKLAPWTFWDANDIHPIENGTNQKLNSIPQWFWFEILTSFLDHCVRLLTQTSLIHIHCPVQHTYVCRLVHWRSERRCVLYITIKVTLSFLPLLFVPSKWLLITRTLPQSTMFHSLCNIIEFVFISYSITTILCSEIQKPEVCAHFWEILGFVLKSTIQGKSCFRWSFLICFLFRNILYYLCKPITFWPSVSRNGLSGIF